VFVAPRARDDDENGELCPVAASLIVQPDRLDDRFNVARSDIPDECFASLRS
jgi:hypothetical protein